MGFLLSMRGRGKLSHELCPLDRIGIDNPLLKGIRQTVDVGSILPSVPTYFRR